jgi:Peptidase family M49
MALDGNGARRMRRWIGSWAAALSVVSTACQGSDARDEVVSQAGAGPTVAQKLAQYTSVRLTADLSRLSERERRMIPLLIQAAQEMDSIFWQEVYPGRDSLLGTVGDSATRAYVRLNYGPWDRLDANRPFVPGVGPRPDGSAFYPSDMTKQEFEAAAKASPAAGESLRSLYTLVRRDSSGGLLAVPYHEAFAAACRRAAARLREAATLADDQGLKRYLELRARALETDDYRPSDLAWMDMKSNGVDVVIGPIETYEDALFGYKAAHTAYVLIKDREWSERLARYAKLLPALQRGLPVPQAYKREKPGTDSDLNAYDAVYYAGQSNSGSKTIAINLPNDEQVQLQKGTRRLQLKNVMRAKFDRILVPIGQELLAEDQREHIQFDSFFANVMFHEVAHGLGVKNTIGGKGTVREALKEQAGALEEGKADILGLYMITRLQQQGELPDVNLDDNYVTFLAGIFRSIRFGAANAHGRANAAELSFLQEHGAFTRDSASGRYRVDFPRMRAAVDSMAGRILRYQGDGDYEGVTRFMSERATIPPALQADLDRLGSKGIPVDVVFQQGMDVLEAER